MFRIRKNFKCYINISRASETACSLYVLKRSLRILFVKHKLLKKLIKFLKTKYFEKNWKEIDLEKSKGRTIIFLDGGYEKFPNVSNFENKSTIKDHLASPCTAKPIT